MLGDGNKVATKSELKNINVAKKSIVAKHMIKKGEIFSETNITTKRPGNGLTPMLWNDILGEKAKRDYEADDQIEMI